MIIWLINLTGANAALLCYDITSVTSFTEMGRWLVELRANLPEDTILHVVGTKADKVAEDPSLRQVPFERVIAYVAENLYPGSAQQNHQGTNAGQAPPMNTPALERTVSSILGMGGGGGNKSKQDFLAARDPPLASPNSNRSSMNFWGQDLGWDCCHEVSASSGEGVEEVFRVITRRLVEQRNNRAALEIRLMQELDGMTPGEERGNFYSEYGSDGAYPHMNGHGSFRVGMGDKRRSWLGLTSFPGYNAENDAQVEDANTTPRRRGCC
jgi:GTPase SAR1 family protein